jgi:hypothetical protein
MRLGFDPGSVHVRFVVDEVALWQVFLAAIRRFFFLSFFTHLHLNTRTALSEGQAGEVSSNSARLQLEHCTKATLGSQLTQRGKITYFLDMYLWDMWLLIQHMCPCWRRMVTLEAQWCNVCWRIKSMIDRPINNSCYHLGRQCTVQKLCFIYVSN